jgi:hypothetical protein
MITLNGLHCTYFTWKLDPQIDSTVFFRNEEDVGSVLVVEPVLHEAALVRVPLQVVVLAQSEDEKAEVVGVDVDDHVNGLNLRNKITQISFLKKTQRRSKNKKGGLRHY